MPKKKVTSKAPADGLLVSAAKNIGKAAAKIASVVNEIAKPKAAAGQTSKAAKRPAKKLAKTTAKPKQQVAPKTAKAAAKTGAASKAKPATRKTK